ncbi:MAG: transketolase [Desulfobacterota bacterium]|nr:transketolase [Thermodesulfobacteriota bacterium]
MNYEAFLTEWTLTDERFVVLTAENRAAIRGLPKRLGSRFIDTGITEQALVGVAAGLALRGRIPIAHGLASFLTLRAYEFIRTDVGLANLPVKLVGGIPGFLSEANGPTHQALEDVGLMRTIPNLIVFCPGDEEDMRLGLQVLLFHPSPCYVRFNPNRPVLDHTPFELGKAEVIAEGSEVTLFVYGMLLEQALQAKELLEAQGRSVGLVNVRTVKPLDEETFLRIARDTAMIVTLEDHFLTGGLFSALSELLAKHGRSCRLLPLALEERWFQPCLLPDLLYQEGFAAEQIAQKILRALRSA